MIVYRAIKTDFLTQGFDAHPSMVEFYKKYGMTAHGGLDFAAFTGEPVYWDCDVNGVVFNTEVDNSGGLGVNIITDNEDGIYKHRFWHLKGFCCEAGDVVEPGTLIGWADNTGASTGTHLHRDMKQMGRNDNGSYTILNSDNGTFGTIRFDDKFKNTFILDVVDLAKKQSLIRKILIRMIIILKNKIKQ